MHTKNYDNLNIHIGIWEILNKQEVENFSGATDG